MFSVSSKEKIPVLDQMVFPIWMEKSERDVVDDLFLAIQNIVAGTATFSNTMLSETCLQFQLQLSANSPIIILRYELESEKVNSNNYEMTFDEVEEYSSPFHNLKNKVPELLLVSNINEEVKEKHLILSDNLQRNWTSSNSIINSKHIMNSTCERILTAVSADDSDTTISQTKQLNRYCENATLNENNGDNGINKCEDMNVFIELYNSCHHCGKSLKLKNMVHEKSSMGEEPFFCRDCGNLSEHRRVWRRVLKDKKPFRCEECGKSFTHLGSLNEHKRIHRDEEPFSRDESGRSVMSSGVLTKHRSRRESYLENNGKSRRKSYTAQFKLEVVKVAKEKGNRQAGRLYNVDESCIRVWRKTETILKGLKQRKRAFRFKKRL